MNACWLLMLSLAGAGQLTDERGRPVVPPIDHSRASAIETRPLWDRPTQGPSLWDKTQAAVDRGNGKVTDQATFDLNRLDLQRAIDAGEVGTRGNFAGYEVDWERQRLVERAEAKARQEFKAQQQAQAIDQMQATERAKQNERSLRPTHEESAIVDRQAIEQADAEYTAAVDLAAKVRDAVLKRIDEDKTLTPAEKDARRAIAKEHYEQRVREAGLRREQFRALIFGKTER